ncbi:hypothetical protein PYJP_12400 [Pyrofollis japonicus]|uniref:hypothetical protein n=1 Tax=Pyrofollis japonicus TaxID=3060460 RepID=UPI00295AE883|nr:hypothetical protein [Pyrofollis japonicus]BEP17888.1 hypothetical protein PYJP_12400 [Pyrofollis japonicus]
MARKVRLGAVIYKEQEDGTTWYIAVEPLSGAQAQGETLEEALERLREEVVRMQDAWCEAEIREAIDAKIIEVELPD